jgi:hypothetical protein
MSHSGSKAVNPRGVGTESPRKQCSSAVARLSRHTDTTGGAVDVDVAEFQLQHFAALVVGNCRERSRLYVGNEHGITPLWRHSPQKQNSIKMLLSEQYWA